MSNRIPNNPAASQTCQSFLQESTWDSAAEPTAMAPSTTQPESHSQSQHRSSKTSTSGPELYARQTDDGVEVGARAIHKTTDSLDASLASASVRIGRQSEAAAHLSRLSGKTTAGGARLSGSAETYSATVAAGTRNVDGSNGFNVKAGANIVACEGTVEHSGNSFTFGVSAGLSGELSMGRRDADNDGRPEQCLRVGAGPVLVGICLEDPA